MIKNIFENTSLKVNWQGEIVSIQPRTRVWRYLTDNRTHYHIGYNLFFVGDSSDDKKQFSVAISEKQQLKGLFRIGDVLEGTAWTKQYEEREFADYYIAGALKLLNRAFDMPRKAHKRGVKGSRSSEGDKRKRGISSEQVCVLCAIDRIGNIITELICKGRMRHTDLERLFKDRIEEESILCTDSHKSYIQFAKDMDIEIHQIKRGKHKEGLYHIQHISAFHSKMKEWMYRFHGVATKYLANYMYWFKWLRFFNTEKDMIKGKQLLVQAHTSHSDTRLEDFKIRQAIYV